MASGVRRSGRAAKSHGRGRDPVLPETLRRVGPDVQVDRSIVVDDEFVGVVGRQAHPVLVVVDERVGTDFVGDDRPEVPGRGVCGYPEPGRKHTGGTRPRAAERRITSRKREVHRPSRAAWRCSPTCALVRERPVSRLLGWLLSVIEQLQRPLTALPMMIYSWAGEAKAEVKTQLAPARHQRVDGDHVPLRRRDCVSSGIARTSGGERAASSAR
jgi:hypothetical protein